MAFSIWNAFLALLMFCGGMALLVFIYMWLAWYASVRATRLRARNSNHDSKGSGHGGLSKSDIQKLPTLVCNTHYQEKEEGENDEKNSYELCVAGDLECTVCLEQFKDGDKCLLMPTCRHCFHVECAYAWLSKHPICPVCRASAHPKDEEEQQQEEEDPSYSNNIPDSTVVDIPS